MDLNELFYHHQIALMSVSQAERDGHATPNFDLPLYFAKRIDEYRELRGLTGHVVLVGRSSDSALSLGRVEPARYVGDVLPARHPAVAA